MEQIIKEATTHIEKAGNESQLEELRVKYLGRKSELTARLRDIGKLPAESRSKAGQELNLARQQLEAAIAKATKKLRGQSLISQTQHQALDLTAPQASGLGYSHPVNSLMDELVLLFMQMGYEIADGPEVETTWHNFEALNIAADHPARDMQDTFYLEGEHLPRTHTSSVQIRYMEAHKPPIRIIAPGKVYRNEDEDPSHLWTFQQIEGLVVDKGISVSDLKGTLLAMVKGVLGDEAEIRLRPSFFPYTEPSIEVDASCVICKGTGCGTCKGTGWLELGGSGMVHPKVLENMGIDAGEYSGFAFGFGLERLAAIKHGIPDLRYFWRPDIRFLEQFK